MRRGTSGAARLGMSQAAVLQMAVCLLVPLLRGLHHGAWPLGEPAHNTAFLLPWDGRAGDGRGQT